MQLQQFQVNEKDVVHEIFNDEILAINLEKGIYFSLRGSGPKIWTMILEGATPSAITESLCRVYEADHGDVLTEVVRFVSQLSEHQLIVPASRPANRPFSPPAPDAPRIAFEPPLLEIFSDMQELLLLDPVHEADATGWPVQKR